MKRDLKLDVETLEIRLILCRKAISMAIAVISGKTVDVSENREKALLELRQAIEMMPSEAVEKFMAMELACLTAQDYCNPCSCCRRSKCHVNCRCSNTGNLRNYLERCISLIS
jgi:hypothetical protein